MTLFSKALVLSGVEGEFKVEEYKVPEPQADEFILRTEYAGVCGTDVHIYYGHLDTVQYPIVLGHEICGVIEKLGKNVVMDANGVSVKEGDRVVVVPGVPCGNCYYCKHAKTPTRCENVQAYGFMPNQEPHLLSGGFSQFVHIQYKNTSFFKTEIDPSIAVLTEPLSICIHGYQKAGGVRFGSTVVVQGTGAIGLGAIAFAKLSGAEKVIAVGGPKRRLQLAKELGADVTIDIEEIRDPQERIRLVKSETLGGRGADMAVECAGVPMAITEGLSYLRDSAKYITLGHFTDVGPVPINPHRHFTRNNIELYGAWGSEMAHMQETLAIMERMDLPFDKFVTHKLEMDRVKDTIMAMSKRAYKLDGKEEVIKVAINPWK